MRIAIGIKGVGMFMGTPLEQSGWGQGWVGNFEENETKNKKRAFRSSASGPRKVTLEQN